MYAVTGATGNTGMVVAEQLLKSGKEVIVIGRNEEKLAQLEAAGAEVRSGDVSDKVFAEKALEGAKAAYIMIPQNFATDDCRGFQRQVAGALASAVVLNGVKHVITLSSVGAQMAEKGGIVQGLHDMEQIFNALEETHVLHLRPGFFMENFFAMIPVIKHMNMLASGIRPDLSVPMVATPDIGMLAARHLKALDFSGKGHQYVLGARDYTYPEAAALLGRYIGKPGLQYVQVSPEQLIESFMQMGATRNIGEVYAEFTESVNNGSVMEGVVRNAENTTPTLLDEFAVFFAEAYKMQ
ncbi:MAG: NmrA family NAD(P)-binding protein [Cyclonatronaceae bacterium]